MAAGMSATNQVPSIHHSLTRKAHIIVPMTSRSAVVGLLPAPRASSSCTVWLALRRAEVHSSHQATECHVGIDEPLLEDVVEDVLEVEEVRGGADVDELRSHLFARARRLVVRDPELGRGAVSGDGDSA